MDLTGYTWTPNNINSVNVTSNDIGNYAINYSITCDNSQYNSTGGTSLNIVFTGEYLPPVHDNRTIAYIAINTLNYNRFGGIMYQGNGRIYESSYNISLPANLHNTSNSSPTYITSITITGGTDATNSTLIAWLEANGTLTPPTPQPSASISIGTLSLAKAFVGNSEVASMWLGNVKLYEKAVAPMNFATDSWASIAANIKSGNDTYQLGDTKTDTITIGGTDYTVTFKIVDDLVGRYTTQSGSSHKVIEMQTIIGPSASSGVAWNSNGEASSYNASDLKSWLNNTAISYLPSALQSVLETTTVYSGPSSDNTTDANKVSATGKLFSPCFNEYYGASATYGWANNYETNSKGQFAYYYNQSVPTSTIALIKQNLTGSNPYYWLRSPYLGSYAVRVGNNGNYGSSSYGNGDRWVCVCFAW